MATYTPKRKTSNGTEDVTFPISAVKGLQGALDQKLPASGGTLTGNLVVTNNSSKQADEPSFKWKTVNSNTPYVGFATDQVDGTFVLASLKGTNYASGLAIGGGSGNLLWKGTRVATADELPTVDTDLSDTSKNPVQNRVVTAEIRDIAEALNGKVSSFTIATEASTTVIDMINAIQEAGGVISDWNVINLKGYRDSSLGLRMDHYGGTVYNIHGINLRDMSTISNAMSWDGVTLGSFETMFYAIQHQKAHDLDTTDKTVVGAINELNGKIGTGSGGGSASKVAITENFPSGMSYIPVLTGKSGDQSVNAHAHLYAYSGPTYSYFNVGSATVNGGLTLHNSNGKYVDINAGTPTANRTISLPDCNGTVITTGNIGMPQIRFAGLSGYGIVHSTGESFTINGTQYVGNKLGLHFTVEIVGGGPLKVGDAIQMCSKKTYPGCRANGYRRRQKLRRFKEYVITADDLNKRFITIHIENDDDIGLRDLFHNGRADTGMFSPIYFRIRRPKGKVQNNNSNMTVDAEFSNVVTVWKSYGLRFEDDNGNTYDKFSIL